MLAEIKQIDDLVKKRRALIDAAEATPISAESNVKRLAERLHPDRQMLKITGVTPLPDHAVCYRMEAADSSKRTAFFRAGQYLSFKLPIGESIVTRPYSISSSPAEALEGFYEVTIKEVPGGYVSTYIQEHWKPGTVVEASAPEGQFYYQGLRDMDTVVGLAGGSGITPLLSMAKDIVSGNAAYNLILLYGCRNRESILYRDELKDLEARSDGRLKVVFVLSEEEAEGYEKGFLSAELITKYAQTEQFSVFICGPQPMYEYISGQLLDMQINPKCIRREMFGQPRNVANNKDYPKGCEEKSYQLHVKTSDGEYDIPAIGSESLLTAMERKGLKTWSCCRSGECGKCRAIMLEGDFYIPWQTTGIRMADKKHGVVHTCSAYPLSDVSIELL